MLSIRCSCVQHVVEITSMNVAVIFLRYLLTYKFITRLLQPETFLNCYGQAFSRQENVAKKPPNAEM